MRHGQTIPAYVKVLLFGFALAGPAGAWCQKQMQARTVLLVSDICPIVHPGDSVSFDVNPLFDPIWPVTGLRGFGLRFVRIADDGVHLKRSELLMGGRHSRANISALGNGFFHVELTVAQTRSLEPGTYALVGATANAEVVPEYADRPPQMTVSPVEERYCITVLGPQSAQSRQPGG